MPSLVSPWRRTGDPAAALRPSVWEMLIILTAAAISAGGLSLGVGVPEWVNLAAPALYSVGLTFGSLRMIALNPASIWSTLLWVRVVLIAYSGIGSLVPFFANDATKASLDAYFTLYPADMVKYNLVVCVYTLALLIVARILLAVMSGSIPRMVRSVAKQRSAFDMRSFGLISLGIGLPIVFFIRWLPLIEGVAIQVPSSFSSLGMLTYLGYALLICHALDKQVRLLWLALPLVLFDALMGVLALNKSEAIMPLLFAFLGMMQQRWSLRRVVIGATAIIAFYLAITPLTNYGRAQLWGRGADVIPLMTSASILQGYTGEEDTRVADEYQSEYARLTYSTAGSFAISQYDQGLPGETLGNAGVVLIPRIFYPEKPEITALGREFNQAVTGSDRSASSPGIPAEAYWNYGWLGVLAAGAAAGLVFACWSLYSVLIVQAGAWHLLFVALLGVRVASRIDGMIVPDFIPMIPYAIIMHYVFSFLNDLIRRRRKPVHGRRVMIGGVSA
jgi:hypothetical protein